MTIYLIRETTKNNKRYYILSLCKNLFGEYIIERIYGNCSYKEHTGKKENYFYTYCEALEFYKNLILKKKKKGYRKKHKEVM